MPCPLRHIRKTRNKCRFMSETAIGGNIDREVATSRILVPESQLHRRIRKCKRNSLQEAGAVIGIYIGIETHAFRTIVAGAIGGTIA